MIDSYGAFMQCEVEWAFFELGTSFGGYGTNKANNLHIYNTNYY